MFVLSDLSRNIRTFLLSMLFFTEFWTKNVWLTVARKQIKLDYSNIILGILDQRSNLLNYFIILGKLYLWNCRKNKQIPLFLPFEDVVKRKYEIEKLIASQSIVNLKYFQAKWNLFFLITIQLSFCKGVSAACVIRVKSRVRFVLSVA